jgi:UPF0716 family protein affecting phage T7 exclusion
MREILRRVAVIAGILATLDLLILGAALGQVATGQQTVNEWPVFWNVQARAVVGTLAKLDLLSGGRAGT